MATRKTTTAETEAPEAPEGTPAEEVAAEANTNGRRMPIYATTFEAQDEPPESVPTGRKQQYMNLLNRFAAEVEPGKWARLVEFQTPNGAKTAYDGLVGKTVKKTGEHKPPTTAKPSGEWEFRAVKTAAGSDLWACLKG